jgi:tetratricopeptide (TPR) repeat protein
MAQGQLSSITAEKRRFAAFISYSHADAAVAAKLQRKLERYRLPKHIVAAQARNNAGLGQIFRDREDLAAAASLSDAIRAAIADAEALIVICSPDAKSSQWVSAEIDLFRELHPDKPVLAALVSGEPAEAFPTALTEGGREPLAADLRPGGDDGSLGFLKIAAGIAGVPLDTLVQRDAQRRVRRVMWITGAALAAMLIMGIMTTLALQARNEAARQRASAEGLVEYMLTDLRAKLEGVGKIDVMRGVNSRAMEYYSSQQDLSSLSADSLLRRARVIEAMGRDDENAGHINRAIDKFLELDRTTTALLKADPDNPDLQFRKAESLNRLALTQHTQGQREQALTGFLKSESKLAVLMSRRKIKTDWLRLAALVYGNICAAFVETGRPIPDAIENCKKAVRFSESLSMREPQKTNVQYDLVFHYVWLADAFAKAKNADASSAAVQRALTLIEKLKENDPENMLWLEQEMQVHGHIASRLKASRQTKLQKYHYEKASKISRMLFDREPRNAVWRSYYEKYANK